MLSNFPEIRIPHLEPLCGLIFGVQHRWEDNALQRSTFLARQRQGCTAPARAAHSMAKGVLVAVEVVIREKILAGCSEDPQCLIAAEKICSISLFNLAFAQFGRADLIILSQSFFRKNFGPLRCRPVQAPFRRILEGILNKIAFFQQQIHIVGGISHLFWRTEGK